MFDVVRFPRAVDHTAAVKQTVVGGEAVVIQQIVTVFDAVVVGDQAARLLFGQRLGDDDLRTTRHAFRGHAVVETLRQISVAGDQQVLGADLAFGGAHDVRLAVFDFYSR
ncbi:hypothetical protein D3C78_1511010 [compost metagenome]